MYMVLVTLLFHVVTVSTMKIHTHNLISLTRKPLFENDFLQWLVSQARVYSLKVTVFFFSFFLQIL